MDYFIPFTLILTKNFTWYAQMLHPIAELHLDLLSSTLGKIIYLMLAFAIYQQLNLLSHFKSEIKWKVFLGVSWYCGGGIMFLITMLIKKLTASFKGYDRYSEINDKESKSVESGEKQGREEESTVNYQNYYWSPVIIFILMCNLLNMTKLDATTEEQDHYQYWKIFLVHHSFILIFFEDNKKNKAHANQKVNNDTSSWFFFDVLMKLNLLLLNITIVAIIIAIITTIFVYSFSLYDNNLNYGQIDHHDDHDSDYDCRFNEYYYKSMFSNRPDFLFSLDMKNILAIVIFYLDYVCTIAVNYIMMTDQNRK